MWTNHLNTFRSGSAVAINAASVALLVYLMLPSIGYRSDVRRTDEGMLRWNKGISDTDRPLAEAVAAIAVDNTIIVSLVNSGYLDFAENWMISIR